MKGSFYQEKTTLMLTDHLGCGPRILSSSANLFISSKCSSSIFSLDSLNEANSLAYGDTMCTVPAAAIKPTKLNEQYQLISIYQSICQCMDAVIAVSLCSIINGYKTKLYKVILSAGVSGDGGVASAVQVG